MDHVLARQAPKSQVAKFHQVYLSNSKQKQSVYREPKGEALSCEHLLIVTRLIDAGSNLKHGK